MKVEELQRVLKSLNLPYRGRKEVLLERLGWAELSLLDSEIFEDQIPIQDNSNLPETTINSNEVNFTKQGPVFKRIPKASCLQSCKAFSSLLVKVTEKIDISSWKKLLDFARCGIGSSKRGGKKAKSQDTLINNRLDAFMNSSSDEIIQIPHKGKNQPSLKNRVSEKMGLGDIKGTINIVTVSFIYSLT